MEGWELPPVPPYDSLREGDMLHVNSEQTGRVVVHLEAALEHIEDPEARYHIREAMQILQETDR